ncbi:MAG TPA: ABC transporter permease [Candidatus Acidoferrum sp.]|nr:ABC transporter permease [Candidatus Acidoferrum sp.]
MSFWRQLTYGLRNIARRRARDRDIEDEVGQFFEEATAAWMERGVSVEEARRRARIELGSIAAARDRASSYGWEYALAAFLRDLRFAARQLRKHPVFTVAAAVTLALGIGANSAIFTVVESVLLAPLPYRNAQRICVLDTHWTDSGHTSKRVTGPDSADVRIQARSFTAVSLYFGGSEGVALRGHSVYTVVTWADADFARVFSLKPIAGRLYVDGDANHAALVSEEFARDNYGGANAAVGQVLHIENQAVEVVGVLPGWFDFPAHTQVWEAAPIDPVWTSRTAFNYKAVGLLRTGVSLQAVQAELNGISYRLEAAYPSENRDKVIVAQPLQRAMTGEVRPTLMLLWAAAGLILLIACVNVMHLQLTRSMERQREIAVRKALGSSRWRVVQPVLIESLLVSLIGGTAGLLLAFPVVHALVAMAPRELPRASQIHPNGSVLALSLGIAVLTALLSSTLPALSAGAVDPAGALKRDTSRSAGRRETKAFRDSLIVAEVTATFTLAVGAGLLLHTMVNLMATDMGYETREMLVVDADAPAHSTEDCLRVIGQFNTIFTQLATLPGVERVAGIMGLPTGIYGSNGYYNTRGGSADDRFNKASADFSVASPGYFQTMGIPIERGRDFSAHDTFESPFVAVISESLAKRSFGYANPIGKQIQCGLDSDKWMTIVGVVGDVRQDSPAEMPGPTLYMPMTQHPFYANQINIVLRTQVKPLTLMNAAQETILAVNPLVALRFTTMGAMVDQSMAAERFRATLVSAFAGVGLLLATLGVYGMMAYSVAQRNFEIGVRMAFGAERGAILGTVIGHAAKLACWGITAGLVLSLTLARLVASMLVGVRPADPISLTSAASLLLLTALGAALIPSWKATRVDPIQTLRAE